MKIAQNRWRFCITAFWVFCSGALYAQDPILRQSVRFERISLEKGLSHEQIICILQDDEGWLWFGTKNGLNRFDGYRFKVWKNTSDGAKILPNNKIQCLYQARSGLLWIGTPEGLASYDPKKNFFKRYLPSAVLPGRFLIGNIMAITEDAQNNIWLGASGEGLFKLSPDQQKATPNEARFQHVNLADKNGSEWIQALHTDRSGTLWVCAMSGLYRSQTANVNSFLLLPKGAGSDDERRFISIAEDKKGSLWLGTTSGILTYDRDSGAVRNYADALSRLGLPNVFQVEAITEDDQGKIWFATFGQGLLAYDVETDRFQQYLPDRTDQNDIGSTRLLSLLVDRTGILWIGSQNQGVSFLNPDTLRFGHHRIDKLTPDTVTPEITAIFQDRDDQLWLGASNGLFQIDANRKLVRRLMNEPDRPDSLSHNEVSCFLQDNQGNLWVGTRKGGLNRTKRGAAGKPVFRRFRHGADDPTSLGHDGIACMFQDRAERIWIGTLGAGLNLYNATDETFTRYQKQGNHAGNLSDNIVSAITQDKEGGLWVGTNGGLNYSPSGAPEDFEHAHHDSDEPSSLDSENILSLLYTQKGELWVGTQQGLNKLESHGDRFVFRRYGEREGLPDGLFNILEGENGLLWISTSFGLVRFDPESEQSRIYGARDGMQSDRFNYGTAFKNRRGKLFFGGENGFNAFFSSMIKDSNNQPPVFITDLQLLNESVEPNQKNSPLSLPITRTNELELSYRDNVVSFELAALDYAAPERNQYRYKLQGLDEDWRTTNGAKRYVTYTNLSPGKYVFRVKGSNRDGVWSQDERTLRIRVTPPFWATPLAYLFYALSVALVIAAYLRNVKRTLQRERQINERLDRRVAERTHDLEQSNHEIRLQQQRLHEMDQLKTRFFTNISHEFRTPLTLTIGPLEDLLQREDLGSGTRTKLRGIHRNAQRLLGMINELLDVSKLEAGKMRLRVRPRDLPDFIKDCVKAFMPLAERKRINLSTRLPEKTPLIYIDDDKLEKVLYNLLSNAFKHVPETGRIVVTLTEHEDRVAITVKDNGPGVPHHHLPYIFDRFYQFAPHQSKALPGTGIGLSLAQQLIQLHGGDIAVNSDPGFGCEFTVTLLKGSDHFTPEQLEEDEPPALEEGKDLLPNREDALGDNRSHETSDHTPEPVHRNETTVLTIEDNNEVRAYICEHLARDHETLEASTGERGLELALDKVPDLIICDVMLPGLDGLEICRRLKRDERTSHIPVIILTARATSEQKIEGLQIGADDYLVKPFNAQVLTTRVENLIRNRQRLRELFSHKITAAPSEINAISGEEAFLQKAVAIIEENISETGFGVNELAAELSFSRRQLHRKITAITGKTPFDLLRSIRLGRAAQLLRQQTDQISQIAYAVGFSKTQHFSNLFREVYGVNPSEYAARGRENNKNPR